MRLLAILIFLFGCKNKLKTEEINFTDCKCKEGSFFPETQECKEVFYLVDPCGHLLQNEVCGCDNMVYQNECYQHLAGVKKSTIGQCPN